MLQSFPGPSQGDRGDQGGHTGTLFLLSPHWRHPDHIPPCKVSQMLPCVSSLTHRIVMLQLAEMGPDVVLAAEVEGQESHLHLI